MRNETPRLRLGLLLLAAIGGAPAASAQSTPRPGAPLVLTVMPPDGKPARARGYTHAGYLGHGRYPLVLILCDRDPATVIAALPHAVVDRKRVVVVAVEVGSAELTPAGFPRLQEVVAAATAAVDSTWSVDLQRTFLLGVGKTGSRALAVARSGAVPVRGAIAWGPVDAWQPEGAAARPPMLVVSAGGKAQPVADALAVAARCRAVLHPHGKADDFEQALQPILEWLQDRGQPPPKDDKDRIKGRTVAARGSKQRVVVIKGEYDAVEQVLTTLEIPHVAMTWAEFKAFDLGESDVLLINCSTGAGYDPVKADVAKKLRQFVNQGGCVFATDWALRFPLVDVFGDLLGCLEPGVEQAMVDVRPGARMHNHDLLQNVFPLDQPPPRWQLDDASWLMQIKVPGRVDVLMESDEMAKAYDGNRAIGACCRVGAYGGLVLNVVSHFSHQGDGGAETPMYQLIVNFIDAAKRLRESRR